jgi:hypothetical protein
LEVNGTAEAYAWYIGPVKGEVGSDRDDEEEEAGAEEEDRCQVCALGGFGDGDAERQKSCVLLTGQLSSSRIEVSNNLNTGHHALLLVISIVGHVA